MLASRKTQFAGYQYRYFGALGKCTKSHISISLFAWLFKQVAVITPFGVGGAQPPQMGNIILQFTQSIAQSVSLAPFLAMGLTSPFVSADIFQPSLAGAFIVEDKETIVEQKAEALRAEKAEKIDFYFTKRGMPLAGYGMKMVVVAEEHNLDWRLLPAIAVRESSGGKQACGYNPFGWASCKVNFKSYNEAIEILARNLGGKNPNTADYYSGTTERKLHHYNGTVVPTYTEEVLGIMEAFSNPKKILKTV